MTSAVEFDVGGRSYRADKLNAFQQVHVCRRLAPMIVQVVSVIGQGGAEVTGAEVMKRVGVLGGLAEVLATMKDEDLDTILNTALSVVSRQEPEGWRRIMAQNATGGIALMVDDLDMTEMLQVAWRVVEPYLRNFMSALPSISSGAGAS